MRDQDGAPLADTTQDYRLPKNVTPKRYDIRLTPDLKAFTFQGEVNIAVVVNEATDDVVLNALELEIDKVTAERGGKSLAGRAELGNKAVGGTSAIGELQCTCRWEIN